ncbi:hypothetical protein ANCCAN_05603 [Ancylostoma caninum]|uniref:Uncharacterized protein n=1 Tax=Ancylostoma caninum TaxID=29170 RepID=A0A368GVG0_ANCCA|nr:hypothetical protein ANCCAN_05603 [Ancylostoma caninum]
MLNLIPNPHPKIGMKEFFFKIERTLSMEVLVFLQEIIQEEEFPAPGSSKGSSCSGSRPTSKTPLAVKKKQQSRKRQGVKAAKAKQPPPRPLQTPHRTRDNEPAFDPFQQRADQRITRNTPMGKLERIARGEKKDKDAYPTLGDVPSDWDDDSKEVSL